MQTNFSQNLIKAPIAVCSKWKVGLKPQLIHNKEPWLRVNSADYLRLLRTYADALQRRTKLWHKKPALTKLLKKLRNEHILLLQDKENGSKVQFSVIQKNRQAKSILSQL